VGDRGAAVFVPGEKARIAWKQKDYDKARFLIAQAIKAYLEFGANLFHLGCVFKSLVAVFVSEGRHERATELLSFVWQQADTMHAPVIMDTANQSLDSLAEKLPQDRYQQAIERGKKLHIRTILEQLQNELADYSPLSPGTHDMDSLSERELDVLRLVAAGRSNRQIADDLVLTLNTVKSHIHHVYSKLGVESRTQAIARARDLNLL
jgi:ATP/maltotriose-dependent transcriptional regulator MalT